MPRGVNDYDTAKLQGRNVSNADSFSIISPGLVTSGLVLHLNAGNFNSYPIAGTTIYDLSESRADGTVSGTGSTYVRDGGGAIDLNASPASWISCPTSVGNFTTQDFSCQIWIYLTSTSSSSAGQGPVIFWKGNFQTNGYYCQINQGTPPAVLFYTNQSGASQVTQSTATLTVGAWNCICTTRTGTSVRTYINGADATSTAGTHTNPAASSNNFFLNAYSTLIYGNVTYSMFSIYNRRLTPTEVEQNFNATRARFGI